MKKWIVLTIALVIVVLGSYYVTGVITERTLKKNIAVINKSSGVKAEIKQYHRGWFTSQAQLVWNVHIPEQIVKKDGVETQLVPAQDHVVDMPLAIYHGPIIFADRKLQFGLGYAHTDIMLPKTAADTLNQSFTVQSGTPQLKMSILVNYLNRSRLRLQVPALKLVAKTGNLTIDWLGATNDVRFSPRMDHFVKGNLSSDGVLITKDDIQMSLKEVDLNYTLFQSTHGMYLGKADLTLPSMYIKNKDQLQFELEDFALITESKIDKDLFYYDIEMKLKKMINQGKTYGPGEFKASIKNLDATILARINQKMAELQQAPEAQKQQLTFTILSELPALLAKGAELEVATLKLVMPSGVLQGNLLISLPVGQVNNPFQLPKKIQGKGKFELPIALVKGMLQDSILQQLHNQAIVQSTQPQPAPAATPAPATTAQPQPALTDAEKLSQAAVQADKKLATLVASGLLIVRGNDYIVEFQWSNGQLLVNNKPFNPITMQF